MKTKLGEGSTPLAIKHNGAKPGFTGIYADNKEIARCWGKNQESNARLIAKAPLLVEARDVLGSIETALHRLANGQGTVNGVTLGEAKRVARALRDQARALLAKLEEE